MDLRLDAAIQLTQAAGRFTLDYFNQPNLQVETKADQSPVTLADKGAEELIRKGILERFADDAIFGEEFGKQEGTSGFEWIIDPIDGTKSFIHGVPLYGTLLAVTDAQGPFIGVVHTPATGEMVYAIRGGGAFYKPAKGPVRPAKLRDTSSLEPTSLILTSGFEWSTAQMRQAFTIGDTMVRTWGDAYAWILLASGRADAMIDHGIQEYDIAPLRVIIPEAGGTITVWETDHNDLAAVVSTKGVHADLLKRFKG